MTKKKPKKRPSDARQRRLAPLTSAMKKSPTFSGLVPKPGRPKSRLRQKLRNQLDRELAWLGMPHKSDLELARILSTPGLREKYRRLTPGVGPLSPQGAKTYEEISKRLRTFRREIANAQRRIWGPKIRSVPLQQKNRLNNFGRAEINRQVLATCGKCFRDGVYVGPCFCLPNRLNNFGH